MYTVEFCRRLRNHPSDQFGFRSLYSTKQQILRVVEYTVDGRKRNMTTGIVSLNAFKVYDRLWPEGLLIKMDEMGVPSNLIQVIDSFLERRRVKVKAQSLRFPNLGSRTNAGSSLITDVVQYLHRRLAKAT